MPEIRRCVEARAAARRLSSRSERPQPLIRERIVDFDCFAARLVIEVDGDVHDMQRTEDERRMHALQLECLELLRVRTGEGIDVTVDSSGNKVFPM